MRWLRGFGRFWYGFIVGDDWVVAVAVVLGVAVTALVAHAGVPAWWVLPAVVAGALVMSVARARRPADRR